LTNGDTSDSIVLAIKIDDTALVDRLTLLLSDIPGLRIALRDETADVVLVSSRAADLHSEKDAAITPRELEVLNLLVEGASNKTIARRLGISIHTAKFHVGSLLDKLDATGRTDAVTHAARLGVIQL
jgi:DNA-binding CsgD family transcriptional regulator